MFENLGQMMNLAKRAGEIQKNIKAFREEMARNEYSAASGGDAVKVVVSGDFRICAVSFGANAPFDDPAKLAELTLQAANTALLCAKNAAAEGMKEAAGGIDLNGLL